MNKDWAVSATFSTTLNRVGKELWGETEFSLSPGNRTIFNRVLSSDSGVRLLSNGRGYIVSVGNIKSNILYGDISLEPLGRDYFQELEGLTEQEKSNDYWNKNYDDCVEVAGLFFPLCYPELEEYLQPVDINPQDVENNYIHDRDASGYIINSSKLRGFLLEE